MPKKKRKHTISREIAPNKTIIRTPLFTYKRVALAVLVLGFLIRYFFLPNPGFEADISFWKGWGLAPFDKGVPWTMYHTNNNYPTPFAYGLQVVIWIYSFFRDPHNYRQFWMNTNVVFLTIVKIPAILADFAIFGLFIYLGKHARKLRLPQVSPMLWLILGSFFLLNPISIIDGAWWGQIDSIGVLLFLISLIALLWDKSYIAGLIYIIAVMTKLQNMIYGPLYFLFIWQLIGMRGFMQFIFGALTGFFALNIEFFLDRDMDRVMQSLTENYDYFPLMSLNAYNPWWIFSGAKGMKMSDKLLAVGIMNAKSVGLIFFSGTYLFASLHLFTNTWKEMWNGAKTKISNLESRLSSETSEKERISNPVVNPYLFPLLTSLCLVVLGFFLFQTQSHDRYAYPLIVFLLLLVPFIPKRHRVYYLFGYAVWSIMYFYNLHSALAEFYPDNALPILRNLMSPELTILAAVILTAGFFVFVVLLYKQFAIPVIIIPILYIVLLLFKGNWAYIQGEPIYLSTLTPFRHTQDWGGYKKNRATNSGSHPKDWHRLSTQYYFYENGLGTHAAGVLGYDINGKFTWLTTDYGVDTEAGPQGSVQFQVWGDGRLLWESEKMGRYDNPRYAAVDISGVDTLELITTNGGNGNVDDHADWLNTKLWRYR